MTRCDELRELLAAFAYGELDGAEAAAVEEHLGECAACRTTVSDLGYVVAGTAPLAALEPRPGLEDEIGRSRCRRWLGMLFAAVDHELAEEQLTRLLSHLDACPACRRAWGDLTLMRQVGEALTPPPGLVERNVAAPRWRLPKRVLGMRTATAAAYLLAVLTSLVVGNPVSLARLQGGEAVAQVKTTIHSEVAEATDAGRGEIKVMLFRAWQWGERQVHAIKELLPGSKHENEQSTANHTQPETRQGGSS